MKLNLGAGPFVIDGYASVDLKDADITHDLRSFPWPFMSGSVEAILASHILEHFDKSAGRLFLRECYRILQPGGVLALAVPNMDKFVTAHLTGSYEALGGYLWIDMNALLGGGDYEPNPAQRHRYMYTWESLAWALKEEGFEPSAVTFDTSALGLIHTEWYRAISLYVDARRPE